ncbi:MAG: histone deacetylase family protein [Deltaproteobacteria bacterium]|nr:MAG: histone deacetylase family protein [Deltaproteobacteria bacterium]
MAPFSLVYHDGYLTPYYTSTVECPERVKAAYAKLKDRFPVIRPEPAELEDLYRVHSRAMVERVKLEGRDTYETALLAVGGAIAASQAAIRGMPAIALLRPPGHHAGPDHYWGYCFFNNIAVAITKLMAKGSVATALVLDLDLHHGDGTENIFAGNQGVKVVNIREKKRTAYLESLEKELESSDEFDLLAISAGFDTYVRDWGGILETDDYLVMGSAIRTAALRLCEGKFFAVLEGGYYLPDLGTNVLAFCDGLAGE